MWNITFYNAVVHFLDHYSKILRFSERENKTSTCQYISKGGFIVYLTRLSGDATNWKLCTE